MVDHMQQLLPELRSFRSLEVEQQLVSAKCEIITECTLLQ